MHRVLRECAKYNTNTLRNFIAGEKFLHKSDVRFSPALRRFVLKIRFVIASIQFINDRCTRDMIVLFGG